MTLSVLALFFAFLALAFLPEHEYRLHQRGTSFVTQAGIIAAFGLSVCVITLVTLLGDDQSGYPAMRLSVATLLWALACVPILLLTVFVIDDILKLWR